MILTLDEVKARRTLLGAALCKHVCRCHKSSSALFLWARSTDNAEVAVLGYARSGLFLENYREKHFSSVAGGGGTEDPITTYTEGSYE